MPATCAKPTTATIVLGGACISVGCAETVYRMKLRLSPWSGFATNPEAIRVSPLAIFLRMLLMYASRSSRRAASYTGLSGSPPDISSCTPLERRAATPSPSCSAAIHPHKHPMRSASILAHTCDVWGGEGSEHTIRRTLLLMYASSPL